MESVEILTLQETLEEQKFHFCPQTFDEFLGQTELKKKLLVYTKAAKMRNEPLDHILFLVLLVLVKQHCHK